jgi:formate dehydrogenase family accessory protein FdhD
MDLKQMQDPLGLLRLGYAKPLLELQVRRWRDGMVEERTEPVVEETPVAVVYNGVPHVVMMATPIDLEDFVLGFSLTEELIRTPADLLSLEIVRYSQGIEIQVTVSPECDAVIAGRTRRLTGRTGCGICGSDSIAVVLKEPRQVPAGTPVPPASIQTALEALTERQDLNAATGAVHAAAWASANGSIELVREDVGRHNALDKLIGAAVKQGVDPATGFVVVTSRASFEMVQKAMILGAPLLAASRDPLDSRCG